MKNYISELSEENQEKFRELILFYGLNEGYRGEELEELTEQAMDSKVSDILDNLTACDWVDQSELLQLIK